MNKRNGCVFLLALLLFSVPGLLAQDTPSAASATIVDNPSEVSKFKDTCGSFQLANAGGCAELLFTGHPWHIAVGNLAPQNGFGAGVAYVGFIPPTETWLPSWNADGVVTPNGSWRAGVYFKLVHTPNFKTTVHYGKPKIKSNLTELPEHPVVNLYAEATSLNKLAFFGLGSATSETERSYFGMREVIVGANAVKPFAGKLNLSLLGEMNGRFVDIRSSAGNGSPSIAVLYTDVTAPGLATQPGFLQFGEAIRMRPIFGNDHWHLNYQASYQQFVAPADSRFSFERFNLDLSQDYAIYALTTRFSTPRDANGPDECSIDRTQDIPACYLDKGQQLANCESTKGKGSDECKAISRNLQGSVGFRFLLSASMTPSGNVVPFYFQPTLGGSDINNNPALASYQDYRFRAPDIMLLRENFEHSIGSLPLGIAFLADQGKVGLDRSDLGSGPWFHSYAAGLTLRAGGFPQIFVLFAWGGKEGTHTIANVNMSLLGGSPRPPLD
jgi:hypothetical protein